MAFCFKDVKKKKKKEKIKKFLLAGDRFNPDNPDLHIILVDYLLKTKKYKNLKKQEIQDILFKTS